VLTHPEARPTEERIGTVDEVRIPPAGDPFTARRAPSTRHHRCTPEFLGLLEEDFGIPRHALNNAFMGVPREPKKEAIALCAWASRTDDPPKALLSWARKNQRGTFRPDTEE